MIQTKISEIQIEQYIVWAPKYLWNSGQVQGQLSRDFKVKHQSQWYLTLKFLKSWPWTWPLVHRYLGAQTIYYSSVLLSLMSWSILKPTFSTDRQPFVGFVSTSTGVEDSKLSLTSINRSEILVFPPGLTQTNMHFYQ